MSKEKLYGLRDQLGKFLYDPTPDQTAWRDKLWEEGRFDEILKTTKQVEEQFDYVEKQIEAFEAAEPSVGEKIVANTLLNLPLGKGLKGTGIGSLLGIAEEELGAAETQRLDDIKKEINQLNAIRQRDLEGGKVTSGTISGIDAKIEKLMGEKEGLMSLISKTPTTGEDLVTGTDWLAAEGMNKPPYLPGTEPLEIDEKKFVSKAFAQRNPTVVNEVRGTSEWFGLKLDEAELQKLSAEDAETAKDVLKRQRRVDKRMPEVQMYGGKEKRAAYREIDAEYQPYLDILNKKIKGIKTPTTGEVKPGTLIPSIKQELKTDLDLKKDYAEFFTPRTPIKEVENGNGTGITDPLRKNLADFEKLKISAPEAWKNISPPYTTEEINKLEKDEFKSAFRLAEEKWQETKSEYHKEAMRQLGVRAYGKGYLKGDIGWTDLGYQGGGLIMNYGDYGRSYT